MEKIINIAVVAHVDAGKSTLVDALLKQNETNNKNIINNFVMDNNDLEKERGITIYSKNCSIRYKDRKINIVDTPGHADFSSEVERIIKTVDTVVLLVDSSDGPMPQTKFVLKKALENNLKPVLFINKIDKSDARPAEVVDMTFDLFCELNASDEQLDFPIIYGVAKNGIAKYEISEDSENLNPLLDTILERCMPYQGNINDNLQLQISNLDYDDYIGRLGCGRISKGKIKKGETVNLIKNDGSVENFKITKIFINEGVSKIEVNDAYAGEMVVIAGCPHISIGDTICPINVIDPLPPIEIARPTLSMNFLVNNGPLAGLSGKFLTNRHIKERLEKELEINVGLEVEELINSDGFKVSGRGELHLSVLLENMRREGYELCVSKPEVLFKEIDGEKYEPFENVIVNVPNEYSSTIINTLQERKATLLNIGQEGSNTILEFIAPTRGLIGYRSNFITLTKGEGEMFRSYFEYQKVVPNLQTRKNGVLISMENGKSLGYSLFNLQARGSLIIKPAIDVYIGMIVGIHNGNNDLNVNPCKNKELTNMRSKSSDESIMLTPPHTFTLETALEFIESDEYVEITPSEIRLRKKELDPRFRNINKR